MPTEPLKLMALEEEDLATISALMQDAVFVAKDLTFSKPAGRLELQCNRFVWEEKRGFFRKPARRRAVLVCKRVSAVRSIDFTPGADDAVANLLAIQFEKTGDGPEGSLVFTLSGGGEIVADAECIEVLLSDLTTDWEARGTPHHPR
ncbi:DUF2948 family protein [Martelella endophytica]|uniref:DUF2948 domain-containing protein n=1 Tax=Martelella endophytica TaxID=1486262 RepID=A0A0D5LVX8_MAREN|nr:DUF2948 family protein [Martelella endophytica]AJY48399.1 hypothetical protein TM49_20535 [Martelella endophytica]